MRWVVVIPVKRLDVAKSRLGADPLLGPHRADLALAFALDVAVAVRAVPRVAVVVAVTDDPRARAALRDVGVDVAGDVPDAGINPALRHGAEAADVGGGVAAVAADLPALSPADLAAALDLATGAASAFVTDAAARGTTAYLAGDLPTFRPRFGAASAEWHRASHAVEIGAHLPRLRRDVDTADDLRAAAALGLGPHTRDLLASAGWS